MRVFLFLLAACLCLPSYAASIDSYVPGQPKSFEFRLPPVSNLGSYNVELLLTSPTGVAGTDFYFDASATAPAASNNYIFSSAVNFFASVNALPGNTHSLTLSDFSLTGTNVIAGTNDAVASVVFRTSPSFNGLLSLSLGEDTFQLDTPDATPTSVPEYAAARSTVAADMNVSVPPVPEPTSISISVCSVLALGLLNRLARRRDPLTSSAHHSRVGN